MSANKKTIKKQNNAQMKSTSNSGKMWKATAIIAIALFCLSLVFGAIRVYHFKSEFTPATKEQTDAVKMIVASDLNKSGEDINSYDLHVNDKIRFLNFNGESLKTIQLSLKSKPKNESSTDSFSTNQVYIVDLSGKRILVHSKTESFGFIRGPDAGFGRLDDTHARNALNFFGKRHK